MKESNPPMTAIVRSDDGTLSARQVDGPTPGPTAFRGGRLVVVPSPDDIPSDEVLDASGVTSTWILVEPGDAALEAIGQMIEPDTPRVVGDTRRLAPLAELREIGEAVGPLGELVATVS